MQVQAINTSMPARQANFGSAGKVVSMAVAGMFTAASTAGAHATAPMEKAANKVLPGIESQAFFASNISKDGKVVSNFRPSEIQPAKTAELNAKAPVVNDPWYMHPENIMHSQEFKSSNGKSYILNFAHDPFYTGDSGVTTVHLIPKNPNENNLRVIGTVVHVDNATGKEKVGLYCWDEKGRTKGEILVPDEIAEQVFSLREGEVLVGNKKLKPSEVLLQMFKSSEKYSFNTEDMNYVAFSVFN